MGTNRVTASIRKLIKGQIHVINAVIEKLANNRYFKKFQPCIVLANGFYEFHEQMPYRISYGEKTVWDSGFPCEIPDFPSKLLFLAALYDGNNFVVCTKRSTQEIDDIHHRMPVLLTGKTQVEDWLMRRKVDSCVFEKKSFGLEIVKLGPFVSKNTEKSVNCLMRFEEYEHRFGMKKYYKTSPKKLNLKSEEKIINQILEGEIQKKFGRKASAGKKWGIGS